MDPRAFLGAIGGPTAAPWAPLAGDAGTTPGYMVNSVRPVVTSPTGGCPESINFPLPGPPRSYTFRILFPATKLSQ